MALDPIINQLTFSADSETGTITDSTVYGTGGNPARNTLAVFLELWKMDKDSNETSITIDNTDPENVTSWDFDSSTDGWYRARVWIIPEFNILTAYTIGQVIYYPSTSTVYIVTANGTGNLPTNTSFFSPTTFNASSSANNITTEYQDYLVIERGLKCAGEATGKWYKNKNCGNCDKIDLMAQFLQKRAMVIAAQRFAGINLYPKAEEVVRKLEIACESC